MNVTILWPLFIPAVLVLATACWVNRRRLRSPRALSHGGMALLLVLIALQPSMGNVRGAAGVSDVDVLLVVDTTTSMAAEDHNGGPRLAGVAADTVEITKQFAGARFSIVSFSNQARVEVPLTTDAGSVQAWMGGIFAQNSYYGAGSSIDMGLEKTSQLAKRTKEATPERRIVVIYLGDGEQTTSEPRQSWKDLRPYVDAAYVLGYGTAEGGKMKQSPRAKSYVKDAHYDDAISKLDEGNLRSIASDLGGTYLHRMPSSPMTFAVEDGTFVSSARGARTGYPVGWILAIPLAGGLLAELYFAVSGYARARKDNA